MDLLRYSAIKEQADVISCTPTLGPIAAAVSAQLSPIAQSACWFTWKERLAQAPWNTGNWVGISNAPAGTNIAPGAPNSLCVRDGTNWRCGVSCAWTVPTGATNARFQIWGAGAASGSGCCCGGSPFGGSGAYASIIIPVTVGDSYTLCAACAACCYCTRPSNNQGCASFVLGPRLCNFCAEGGCHGLVCWYGCINPGRSGDGARISTNCYAGACGPSICNGGGDFCSYSCLNMGTAPITFTASPSTFFGCATNGTPAQGLNGMWPCFGCTNTTFAWGSTHPPIYGFESVSQCTNCAAGYGTGAAGGQAQFRADTVNFMRFPGAGGAMSSPCSGCNAPNSDSGRFGMVCVTWW